MRRLASGAPRPASVAWVEALLREWEEILAAAVALDVPADGTVALEEAIDRLRRLAETDSGRLAARLLGGCLQGVASRQARQGLARLLQGRSSACAEAFAGRQEFGSETW